MDCDSIEREIDVFIQNPEDEALFREIHSHLQKCAECREGYADIFDTALKVSQIGSISDIIDVSDSFIKETRNRAKKESDRYRVSRAASEDNEANTYSDYIIIALIIMVLAAAAAAVYFILVLNGVL